MHWNGMLMQAIEANPRDAALYTSRAQAHIQLENWLDAAEDASQALTLDPRLAKAHFRKGCAPPLALPPSSSVFFARELPYVPVRLCFQPTTMIMMAMIPRSDQPIYVPSCVY